MRNSIQLPDQASVDAELFRRSFRAFVPRSWPLIEANPFVSNWHVDAIADALEAVSDGQIPRLLVNIPPRHLKSTLTSVMWPAWLWLRDPTLRILSASYALPLAIRDANRSRRVITADWYQARGGDRFKLMGDQNTKSRYDNDATGFRIASSVGGSATGEGGDIILIDDPHKLEDAFSAAALQLAIEWFSSTISSRLNDLRTGRMVVIAQRIHEDDLSGHLLETGDWYHLCLPAEYDASHLFIWPDDPRSEPEELLFPERFGRDEIDRLKRSLGPYASAGQLQQLPAPAGGEIFKTEWWSFYDPALRLRCDDLWASWDLTFEGSKTSDYVVGQLWLVQGVDKYLIRQVRERMSFVDTIQAIEELTDWAKRQFGYSGTVLIEGAANGNAAYSVLREKIPNLKLVPVQHNKLARAHGIAVQMEAGNVHLPGFRREDTLAVDRARTPAWVQDYIHELATFPNGAHDDQVDATTQALTRIARPGPRLRVLSAEW